MNVLEMESSSVRADLVAVRHQLTAARSEISKLHQQLNKLSRNVAKELASVRADALAAAARSSAAAEPDAMLGPISMLQAMRPIGCIESCFPHKNGTPRQPQLAPGALARLRISVSGMDASHTVDGLSQFSHVWLIFLFHRNGGEAVKAKVHPPRLGGHAIGLFACRTPHRPCALGLSLVTLLGVEGDTLLLAGADLIDGTPVVDIKPFHPYADAPPPEHVRAPPWLAPESGALQVRFTDDARAQLVALCNGGDAAPPAGALRFFGGRAAEAEATLADVLRHDPRSVYRKQHCADEPYRVCIDGLDATCRFDGDTVIVEAVRLLSPRATIGETAAADA